MSAKQQRDPGRERLWRKVIAGWKKSGVSVRAYCARRGLREPSFYFWRRTLRERDGQRLATEPTRRPTLVPVRIVADALLEIVLPSGLVVRAPTGTEAARVAALVAALRAASC